MKDEIRELRREILLEDKEMGFFDRGMEEALYEIERKEAIFDYYSEKKFDEFEKKEDDIIIAMKKGRLIF